MAEPTSMKLGTPAVLSLTSTTAPSSAIGTANPAQPNGYTTVRLAVTAEAWLAIGAAPAAASATDGSFLLPAGSVEYVDVPLGHKIAGITASTATLSITPCSKG